MSSLLKSLKIMAHNKVGFAGFLLVVLIVLVAIAGPWIMPLDNSAHIAEIYQSPSLHHLLGTDFQGRDILSQILNGGREVMTVAALTALIAVTVAVVLGSLAALLGGWVDSLIVGLGDLVLTIPQFPLLLVLAGFVHLNSSLGLALILASLSWAALMRSIRAQVLSLKEREYVQAAISLGLPTSHLLFREILPNMMSWVIINFVMAVTGAIYNQVGLIFLGIVPMSTQNWGVMINLAWNQGAVYNKDSIWYIMTPVGIIALLQFALVSMNRSLEEVFNPRLRVGD